MLEQTHDYKSIFLNNAPLIDTRAPIEFIQGSFPTASNLPLMNDEERAAVGTCYKNKGQEAAVKLGHQLVSGEIKQARLDAWLAYVKANPEGYLFCFRGGMRSQLVQAWLHEAGVDYPRIQGGYKALRQFLLQTIEQTLASHQLLILGGMTGCGKTEILQQLSNSIDLEGHAYHRGSSFGRHANPQPSQINFENNLSIDLLKKCQLDKKQLVLEDESHIIGRCALPVNLMKAMKSSKVVWLEAPLEERVERVLKDYVVDLQQEFITVKGEEKGREDFAEHLLSSLGRITKRLGSQRHQQLQSLMLTALNQTNLTTGFDIHREWIRLLLASYYDPMYHYQGEKKASQVIFKGTAKEVMHFLKH
ncbi:MAG: tRNA 2-selenouridine(34) synthase MnmH [Pseudomonadaceae bacterium]|nr:tRNA 2-selenouridine(34) synthase MnmH [Pseudomonadaceae bacterium]